MGSLKEVPTPTLRDMLLAVKDLWRKYRGLGPERFTDHDCPLCSFRNENDDLSRSGKLGPDRCSVCPWTAIDKIEPGRREVRPCFVGGYDTQTTDQRLARCARWNATIREELASRGEA